VEIYLTIIGTSFTDHIVRHLLFRLTKFWLFIDVTSGPYLGFIMKIFLPLNYIILIINHMKLRKKFVCQHLTQSTVRSKYTADSEQLHSVMKVVPRLRSVGPGYSVNELKADSLLTGHRNKESDQIS
jgi:hypothetical protein